MYADDTALSSRLSKPSELHEKLVPDFMSICEWLKANKLSLNIIKTEYMITGTARNLIQLGKIPLLKGHHLQSLWESLLMKH